MFSISLLFSGDVGRCFTDHTDSPSLGNCHFCFVLQFAGLTDAAASQNKSLSRFQIVQCTGWCFIVFLDSLRTVKSSAADALLFRPSLLIGSHEDSPFWLVVFSPSLTASSILSLAAQSHLLPMSPSSYFFLFPIAIGLFLLHQSLTEKELSFTHSPLKRDLFAFYQSADVCVLCSSTLAMIFCHLCVLSCGKLAWKSSPNW